MKICKTCLMDETACEIEFFDDGTCTFCNSFKELSNQDFEHYSDTVKRVKKASSGKYDCIIGVSGGVDSSWVLHKAVESGLNPLAVHMDNGWNSELAQNNIFNLVTKLGVDLHTHVIDWAEYRELMNCFFKSNVIDVELLYDNAMLAVNYQLADKYKVKHIFSGMNNATEGIRMPKEWNWFKYDKVNIKSISSKFGGPKISTFPAIGTLDYLYYTYVKKIKWESPLNGMKFNKNDALDKLQKLYKYKPYPYKHYESVFTRFYQGYILPMKFNVDKRKLHLSNLVITKQMERSEGLKILQNKSYDSFNLENDIEYFLKKMKWEESALNDYIASKPIPHDNYGSEKKLWDFIVWINSKLKK